MKKIMIYRYFFLKILNIKLMKKINQTNFLP